jgi:hypothetical protein
MPQDVGVCLSLVSLRFPTKEALILQRGGDGAGGGRGSREDAQGRISRFTQRLFSGIFAGGRDALASEYCFCICMG